MKLGKYFLLSWKRLALVLVAEVLAIVLHNAVYAIFGVEDALFFILAIFVIPIYLVVSVVFTLINLLKKHSI